MEMPKEDILSISFSDWIPPITTTMYLSAAGQTGDKSLRLAVAASGWTSRLKNIIVTERWVRS